MYSPEYFETRGVIADPEPERILSSPRGAQLFNVAQDPQEENDVALAHPERVRAMTVKIENWFEDIERDRLRSL